VAWGAGRHIGDQSSNGGDALMFHRNGNRCDPGS
jgi:hypothetical protein